MTMRYIALILLATLIVACGQEQKAPDGYLYPDNNGVTIPEKYHVGWPIESWNVVGDKKYKLDQSDWMLEQLDAESINYELVKYRDKKYLIWSEKDDGCVQKIINYAPCK